MIEWFLIFTKKSWNLQSFFLPAEQLLEVDQLQLRTSNYDVLLSAQIISLFKLPRTFIRPNNFVVNCCNVMHSINRLRYYSELVLLLRLRCIGYNIQISFPYPVFLVFLCFIIFKHFLVLNRFLLFLCFIIFTITDRF